MGTDDPRSTPVVMSWSGGKHSAIALHELQVDPRYNFAGRVYDVRLLADLPVGFDPCGEYGEFHSFVYDGPCFCRPVGVTLGETLIRDGRYYADLLLASSGAHVPRAAGEIPPV
jgi:diphthamide synthase (EF-2-diphthine--ammonia ligase)